MAYDGYDNTTGYNSVMVTGQKARAKHVKAVLPPLLEIKAWDKTPTWAVLDSGTTTSTTANKLVDSGATFITAGIEEGMIVKNTTDNTFAIVDNVDSQTTLSLRADLRAGSTSANVFTSGENYTIYLNYELSDAWVECNGQVLNDAESPWNGKTIRNLNAAKVLQGGTSSGGSVSPIATVTVSSNNSTVDPRAGGAGNHDVVFGSSGVTAATNPDALAAGEKFMFAVDLVSTGQLEQIVYIMRVK